MVKGTGKKGNAIGAARKEKGHARTKLKVQKKKKGTDKEVGTR